MVDAVCTHVTSSAASRDSAVKLMTDSYQFWVAHLNLRVTIQSHIRFARKVQKYGDAFSKSSSIFMNGVKYNGRTANISSTAFTDLCLIFFPYSPGT